MTSDHRPPSPDSERFKLFFEAAFEGIGISEDGKVVDVNDRLAEMLGYEREELIGMSVAQMTAPEDCERVRAMMSDGRPDVYQHKAVRKDGTTFPVEVRGRSMEMAGRLVRVTAIQDVTAREEAAVRARESRERLSVLTKAVEASSEVVFLTDGDGVFTYVNPAFTKLYGWEAHEVVGIKTPRIIKSGDYGEDFYSEMWGTLLSGNVVEGEVRNRRRNGEVVHVAASANPIISDDGELMGFLAIQSDISVRKRHEETLLNIARGVSGSTGETFFRDLAHHLCRAVGADAAILGRLDAEDSGTVTTLAVEVDGEPRENFAYPLEGAPCAEVLSSGFCVVQRGVQEVFPDDPGLVSLQAEAYVGKALRSATGEDLGVALVLFREPLGDSALAVGMLEIFAARASMEVDRVRAETQRRKLEEQLRQAQKMEEIGQLTGGIAHDFQNLLSVILLQAELMKEMVDSGEGVTREEVEEVESAAQQAANMTRKLLGFGRRADISLAPTDLRPVVRGMSAMLRRVIPENIDISIQVPEGVGKVKADPGAVEQILLNLATNARDAMPGGGSLEIRLRERTLTLEEAQEIQAGKPGDFLCLEVTDTGVGMDLTVQARVFEPFFTTKPVGEGTGLGLAMVYGLTQQHGGFLGLKSEMGTGTTVSLFLPRATPSSVEAVPVPEERPTVGGEEMLLVVEDQEALRRTLKLVLGRVGYRVLMAEDGEAGLELARAHAGEIKLILSDLVMPRMGGVELYRALRDEGIQTPFIIASGYAGKSASGLAELDPSVPVLKKPWKPGQLLHLVREVLDR